MHVLSTPPAFILSQDRTLIKRFFLGQINLVLVPELTVLGLAFRIPSEKQYGSPFVRKFIKEFSGLVYCSVIKDLMPPEAACLLDLTILCIRASLAATHIYYHPRPDVSTTFSDISGNFFRRFMPPAITLRVSLKKDPRHTVL